MAAALPEIATARVKVRQPKRSPDSLWVAGPLLALAACFFYPLILIVQQSLIGEDEAGITLRHFHEVFGSAPFQSAVLHTIGIALAASSGCLLLGLILALVLAFVPFPGASMIARLM